MAETERTEPRRRKRRKHRWAFPLGLAVILLAIVGVITILSAGVDGIKKLTDDSAEKAEYETFLLPVVTNDPDPFDDITKANMSQLLDSSIWALLKSGKDPDAYEYTQGELVEGETIEMMLIGQNDVAYYFEKLFGTDRKPEHMSVFGGSIDFIYDEARESYLVPITGNKEIYVPKVYEIDKKGDSIMLTVGYIGGSDWAQDEQGNFVAPEPNKYMNITLREKDDSYYISAIQATDALEVADSTAKPATTAPAATQPETEPATTAKVTTTAKETTTKK